VDWLPGLKTFQLKHIPTLSTNPNDLLLDILKGELEATSKASSIILHTFDALEHETLDALSPFFPPIYTVGPLQLLVDQIPDKRLESIDCSLWKQQDECMKWLNDKEQCSVLYVNFGSLAILTESEIVELAWGLANSKKSFLWIIRPDLIKNGLLPPDFIDETND
ncbi:7-deoxyloganetin glucosyltransferase, partial [Phtheirospermum japonicum]